MHRNLLALVVFSVLLHAESSAQSNHTRAPVTGAWATRDTSITCEQPTSERRAVSKQLHLFIYKRDGCTANCSKDFEVDHLIPLAIGGANSKSNLWAQPWPEARIKDKLEVKLQHAVCHGVITIKQAQDSIIGLYGALSTKH